MTKKYRVKKPELGYTLFLITLASLFLAALIFVWLPYAICGTIAKKLDAICYALQGRWMRSWSRDE